MARNSLCGVLPDTERHDQPLPRTTRVAGAGAVAFSTLAWWPAFTLGAWGQVFFEQILSLWAASTAAFVVVVIGRSGRPGGRWRLAALLIPTSWIVISWLLGTTADGPQDGLAVFGTIVTIAGLPLMAALLVQIAAPEIEEDLTRRDRTIVVTAVVVVVTGAFLLGRGQALFLTCDDFTVSGNSAPAGCTPGDSTLGR